MKVGKIRKDDSFVYRTGGRIVSFVFRKILFRELKNNGFDIDGRRHESIMLSKTSVSFSLGRRMNSDWGFGRVVGPESL